jgi:hypothetical protein
MSQWKMKLLVSMASKKQLSFEDYVEAVKDDLKIIPPQKWDAVGVARYINDLANYAQSTYSDGWTQCDSKRELFLLKCLIEDLLVDCPNFPEDEREWEQERLLELLKRQK